MLNARTSTLEFRTRNMWRSAFYGVVVALVSMMPFLWKVTDINKLQKAGGFQEHVITFSHSFRFFTAIEEWSLGIFAISVSAVVNWLETTLDDEIEGPGSQFTAFAFIGGLFFLIFYLVFEKNADILKNNSRELFLNFASYLTLGIFTILSSILSITTIRRSKDRRSEIVR
jgi:hypothetical protein